MKNKNLTLFFSRGVSLRLWQKSGNFEREVALYRRLADQGYNIAFVTYGGSEDLLFAKEIPEIKILCNRWRLPGLAYEWGIPLLHRSWLRDTSVIKTNQTSGADVALRTAKYWGKPLIARCGYMWSEFTAHEYGEKSPTALRTIAIENKVFGSARQVVVTTEEMKNNILKRLPNLLGKVMVIPNYVDTDKYCPGETSGKKDGLIFIGRLEPQKNVESLLEAIRPLDLNCVIVGDGSLRDYLYERFGEMDGRVRWIEKLPNLEIPKYLNMAVGFILPSHYEGHPKTLIEAMACGIPVIGADSPGIKEIVCHEQNGLLCGVDSGSIRQSILRLIADSALRDKIGENGRRYAAENFSLNRIVQKEMELIDSLINAA